MLADLAKPCQRYVNDRINQIPYEYFENHIVRYVYMSWIEGNIIAVHDKTIKKSLSWLVGHFNDVIMSAIAFQITSLTIVYSTVYSDADQRKHQSSASLAFVLGIHRGPVNSPHKWPVMRKMFPFDDVIRL